MSLSCDFRWLVIASALSAGGPLLAGPPERGPKPHLVDLYGDPLPEGAVARLGSVRLRHAGLKDFALLPDGKTVVTVGSDRLVRWWDLDTGRQRRAVRLPDTGDLSGRQVLSADGAKVAVYTGTEIVVCDTGTGRVLTTLPKTPFGVAVQCLTFSPDGRIVAFAFDATELLLITVKSGKLRRLKLPDAPPESRLPLTGISFSGDGRRIVVMMAGDSNRGRVVVLEADSGRLMFDRPARLADRGIPAALSPDGSRLAVSSRPDEMNSGDLVFHLFDVGGQKETGTFPLKVDWFCARVTFAPDGKSLVCGSSRRGYVVDAATGRSRFRFPGASQGLCFSADGRTIAGADGCRIRVWDAASGRELRDRPGDFRGDEQAISPDGRWLASEDVTHRTIGVWDLMTGRNVRLFPIHEDRRTNIHLSFSSDGGELVFCQNTGGSQAWSLATGRLVRFVVMRPDRPDDAPSYLAMCPDGRTGIELDQKEPPALDELVLWDLRTGRATGRRPIPVRADDAGYVWAADWTLVGAVRGADLALAELDSGRIGPVVEEAMRPHLFSPDNRLLVARASDRGSKAVVRLWEVVTGRPVLTFPRIRGEQWTWAIEPRLRLLVGADDSSIRVYDLATGALRGRRRIPDCDPSPRGSPVLDIRSVGDGRHVLTTLADGTALVWDLSVFPPAQLADKHGEPELRVWWDELASDDAAKAYAAGWKLSEAPAADVVAFLRERLRPARGIDRDKARKRIADLDSPVFATREAASRRLQQMGPAVLPYLRHPPAGMSAEAGERLQVLVRRLSDPVPPAETLRVLRAVAVLERAGTDDARKALDELSQGATDAPETKAARSALGRLWRGWNR